MNNMPCISNYLRDNNLDLRSSLKLVLIFAAVFYLAKYVWNRRRLYYWSSKMDGPMAWPIIGNALYFSGGTENILDSIILLGNTYKTPIRVWLGQRLFYGLTKPKEFEVVLNNALEKDDLYKYAKSFVGNGVFTAPVKIWRPHKKVILSTFNPKILNSFVSIFAEQSTILVEQLKKHAGRGNFDIYENINKCTLDIICETAMGTQIQAQTNEYCEIVAWLERALEIVFQRMFQIWLHPDILWRLSPLSAELDLICYNFKRVVKEIIIKKKKEYRDSKQVQDEFLEVTSQRKVLLDYLIELSEEDVKWTDEEILDEALTFVVAGSDSTANIDCFALLMLGMHQKVQDKVYEEICSIFGDSTRNVSYQDLPRMSYLERVIKETLRLFPIAPVIVRYVDQDLHIDHLTLPRGGSCILSIFHAHRDAEIWPDPLIFDPDRFLPEETAKRHPYAFIPFSAGPRSCLGPRYAMMAMKTVLSTIIRHYKVNTDYKQVEDVKVKADLMIKSVHGYKVALELRNKQD